MRYSDRLINAVVAFAFVSLIFMSAGIIHARPSIIVPDIFIVLIFALESWKKLFNDQ